MPTPLQQSPCPNSSQEQRGPHAYCRGLAPLTPRLEAWMQALASQPLALKELVERYGSPLNLHFVDPLERNSRRLEEVCKERGVPLLIYLARKANKCAYYIDTTNKLGFGLDVASDAELQQALAYGAASSKIICTAAIKPRSLIDLCVTQGVTIAIDNNDELDLTKRLAEQRNQVATVALRVGHFQHAGHTLFTRFGFTSDQILSTAKQLAEHLGDKQRVTLTGLHFHLDGSDIGQRVSAIQESLRLAQQLRHMGHPIEFLDIGGGFPMSYIDSETEWQTFLHEHDRALRGERPPLTYRNLGLGRQCYEQKLFGKRDVSPSHQAPTGEVWFTQLLDSPANDTNEPGSPSIAAKLKSLDIELRCEPGRSLLDGCGITAARVEYCKPHPEGYDLIGLAMNRTQHRTAFDDHLVDPLLIPIAPKRQQAPLEKTHGFLTGAYCHESELITKRQLEFPYGVAAGDLLCFPNTAGYLMHFMESRSHQFQLAQNLLIKSLSPVECVVSAD